MDSHMYPDGRRLIVCAIIVGVHALLAYVLLRESATRTSRTVPPHYLAVEAISASLEKVHPAHLDSLLQDALPPARIREVTPLQIGPIEVQPEPVTPGATDWRAEASAAAADILERARRLGHAPNASDAAGKPGAFGSQEQNHRAGRVEGGSRFWVTDNCYYDFPGGLPPPPRLAGEFHLMTPTCKPPPTGGGDQMFEDQKPQSLRAPLAVPAK
ncbi:MAG: hypothetical protein JSR66_19190 [Proteobacteria bacterium]|nr:hypothetical protein [Pseudomonadota bacterium]